MLQKLIIIMTKENDNGTDEPLCVIFVVIFTMVNVFVICMCCMCYMCVNVHNRDKKKENKSVQSQTDIMDIPKIIIHPNREINIAL